LDFYSSGSLKQQSAGRHVDSFKHIILSDSQPMIYHTLDEHSNHYTQARNNHWVGLHAKKSVASYKQDIHFIVSEAFCTSIRWRSL